MSCAWTQQDHEDGDCWETDCGNAFRLESGSPSENSMRFCCYCGRQLEEVSWTDREDEEIEDVHDQS